MVHPLPAVSLCGHQLRMHFTASQVSLTAPHSISAALLHLLQQFEPTACGVCVCAPIAHAFQLVVAGARAPLSVSAAHSRLNALRPLPAASECINCTSVLHSCRLQLRPLSVLLRRVLIHVAPTAYCVSMCAPVAHALQLVSS
jgi:hypothetical protein